MQTDRGDFLPKDQLDAMNAAQAAAVEMDVGTRVMIHGLGQFGE